MMTIIESLGNILVTRIISIEKSIADRGLIILSENIPIYSLP